MESIKTDCQGLENEISIKQESKDILEETIQELHNQIENIQTDKLNSQLSELHQDEQDNINQQQSLEQDIKELENAIEQQLTKEEFDNNLYINEENKQKEILNQIESEQKELDKIKHTNLENEEKLENLEIKKQ